MSMGDVTLAGAPGAATARVGEPKPTPPGARPRIAHRNGFDRFADGHNSDQEKVGRP
jgi:hypothetical protein